MDKIMNFTIVLGIFASILIVLVSMYYKTFSYISLILIIAIICLVGTVVTARFLAKKEVFRDDSK